MKRIHSRIIGRVKLEDAKRKNVGVTGVSTAPKTLSGR